MLKDHINNLKDILQQGRRKLSDESQQKQYQPIHNTKIQAKNQSNNMQETIFDTYNSQNSIQQIDDVKSSLKQTPKRSFYRAKTQQPIIPYKQDQQDDLDESIEQFIPQKTQLVYVNKRRSKKKVVDIDNMMEEIEQKVQKSVSQMKFHNSKNNQHSEDYSRDQNQQDQNIKDKFFQVEKRQLNNQIQRKRNTKRDSLNNLKSKKSANQKNLILSSSKQEKKQNQKSIDNSQHRNQTSLIQNKNDDQDQQMKRHLKSVSRITDQESGIGKSKTPLKFLQKQQTDFFLNFMVNLQHSFFKDNQQ